MGEQIANELVEWFNAVDATYRADLRELNELNFSRFDAKMEQRFAAFESKIEQRFAAFEIRMEQRMAAFEVKMEQRMAAFEVKIERRFAEQTRFLYLALAAQLAVIAGFGTAIIGYLKP